MNKPLKLDEALGMLESVRLMADDGPDSLGREAIVLNIIHILVKYIGHPKIEEKVNEIPF